MSLHSSILFLLVIVTNFSVNCGLTQDSIIGGHIALPDSFGYQVAILGKHNFSVTENLVCSGAIITDEYVLSAAQCFLDYDNNLKRMRFSIAAGIVDLLGQKGVFIDIDKIYITMFTKEYSTNDLAVLKLRHGLLIRFSPPIININLPIWGESFEGKFGIVSGFGYNWIKTEIDQITGVVRRADGGSTYALKYALVEILDFDLCSSRYLNVDPRKQFCGVMHTSNEGESWGICTLDAGAPLVVNDVLVGIASRNHFNCDDTYYGCIYTNVSDYIFFIISVLSEMPFENTFIYNNRKHILL